MNTRRKVQLVPMLLVVVLLLALIPTTDAQDSNPPAAQGLRPDAPPLPCMAPMLLARANL